MNTLPARFVIRRRDGEGKVMPDDRLDARSVKDLLTSIEFELQLLNARFAEAFMDLSRERAPSSSPPVVNITHSEVNRGE